MANSTLILPLKSELRFNGIFHFFPLASLAEQTEAGGANAG